VYPCIGSVIVIDYQQDLFIFIFIYLFIYLFLITSTLHVPRDVFTHRQEHLTVHVFTASDIVHLIHDTSQQQSVGNIRSCKYSQVLLMMGENIARNM